MPLWDLQLEKIYRHHVTKMSSVFYWQHTSYRNSRNFTMTHRSDTTVGSHSREPALSSTVPTQCQHERSFALNLRCGKVPAFYIFRPPKQCLIFRRQSQTYLLTIYQNSAGTWRYFSTINRNYNAWRSLPSQPGSTQRCHPDTSLDGWRGEAGRRIQTRGKRSGGSQGSLSSQTRSAEEEEKKKRSFRI